MSLATTNLNYLVLCQIGNLDRQTLPVEVSMAKLPKLTSTPCVDLTALSESQSVTLSTEDVFHKNTGQC